MTVHRPHPITRSETEPVPSMPGWEHVIAYDDPVDAVLFDGCPRCEQHARTLFSLDKSHLQRLWQRRHADDLTDLEQVALANLQQMIEVAFAALS